MLSFSRALADEILGTSDFATAMSPFFIRLYRGTIPVNADPALPAAEAAIVPGDLIIEYSDNGTATGLTWDTPADGIIAVPASTVVSGTAGLTDSATFFRIVLGTDTGAASTTELRIQGTVGLVGTDMVLGSTAFTSSVADTLPAVRIGLLACQTL